MTRKELMEEFFNSLSCDVDIWDYICDDADDIENFYDVFQSIEDNRGFDVDVTYYSVAIEYLKENDSSLMDSLSLAADMGYEISQLSSELLASLLASQQARESVWEAKKEIDDFLNDLNTNQ